MFHRLHASGYDYALDVAITVCKVYRLCADHQAFTVPCRL
jgi:hypothetical protein